MRMDLSDKQSVDDCQAFEHPAEGIYHVVVKNVDEFPEKYPNAIVVDLEVLAGTVPAQEGKELRAMLFLDDNGRPSEAMKKTAMVVGVAKPGVVSEVVWANAVNAQFVAKLTKVKGKDGVERVKVGNYGLDIWPIGHKDAQGIPLDQAALAIWRSGGGEAGPSAAATAGSQPPQPAPAAAAPAGGAAPAAGDDWGDV